jgi:prolyl oligopeptidase
LNRHCAAIAFVLAAGCSPPPTVVEPPHPSAKPTTPRKITAVPAPVKSVEKPGPPLARREDVSDEVHGKRVSDPYRWLEDVKTDETQRWMADMGGYARGYLDALPGRGDLIKRLHEVAYVEWVSSPQRHGGRYFFTRRPKDKEKAIYYWREGKTGEPVVLLDPNAMSEDGSVAVHGVWPSYDGKWAAYKLSQNNADESTMYLMDVESGKTTKIDTIEGAKYATASWDPKGTGYYYTRLPVDDSIPVADRPGYAEIYFHKIGADPKSDKLIHPKTGDPSTFLTADLSRDGHWLFLYKFHGWTRNDLYIKDMRKGGDFQPFAVDIDAKFEAVAWKDRIYLHSNLDAPRWRMYRVDPRHLEPAKWEEIVPQHPTAVLEDFGVFGEHLGMRYLENASSKVVIADFGGKTVRTIELPGIGSVEGPSGNPEDDTAYYSYSSFIEPSTVFETSIGKGGSKPYFTLDVPVDPKPFTTEQVWYESKDKTRISMFIIRRKDMPKDGSTPFLLSGYGGFNINMTPAFAATSFAWLEHGGAIAIPNLRGGGEYGEEWHRQGMLDAKQNVFDDFIAAAEYLIREGYTQADKLAIKGASNGGLLVGAVMTQRPELFRAVVCQVPLLDMVRYHLFGSGKTWISEYGSADDAAQFQVLYGYSPYHHLVEGTAYPSLLMLSADSDDRVDPMHARKFLAAARWATSTTRPMILRIETHAGHGGGDLVKKRVDELADVYSFLFAELGML